MSVFTRPRASIRRSGYSSREKELQLGSATDVVKEVHDEGDVIPRCVLPSDATS